MSIRRIIALVFCLLSLSLPSCTRQNATALSLVIAMTQVCPDTPAGDIYLLPDSTSLRDMSAAQGCEDAIRIADTTLLSAAFGTDGSSEPWQCTPDLVDDGAMRLSSAASPCEWMVFHCISRADTTVLSELLLGRLEVIRRQYRGSDSEALLAHAGVFIIDHYVLLIVADDPEAAIDAARQALS